jgi:hypothetical protein
MAAEFDAYHKWLAIPPTEQPPNLYRLLALNPFEDDPDVIDSAANARMIHLRSLQTGPQAELTQKLLNEIAAARLCLLKPEKKASYDATLRAQMAARAAARTPPPLPAPRTNSAQAASTDAAGESTSPLLDFISAAYSSGAADVRSTDRMGSRHAVSGTFASNCHSARANKAAWPRVLMILGPLVGIGIVAAAIAVRNAQHADDLKTATNAVSTAGASGQRVSAAAESSSGTRPIAKPSVAKTDAPPPAQPAQAAPPAASANVGDPAVSSKPLPATEPRGEPNPASEAKSEVKPSLPPGAGKVRLQYRCMETKFETNQVRCQFQIANDGDAPLPLADLKVRYWYARAADRAWNFWCDYAAINKDNVAGRFVAVDRPTENAAGYLELTFAAGAGEIKPGADSGEIQCRFAVDDWSNLDQSKDFSFDPAAAQWTANPRVAVYQNGKLMWGREPPGIRHRAGR